MRRLWLSLLFPAVIVAGGCQVSKGDEIGSQRNVALGKTCRFSPAASYHLTHSADDARKLTDGRRATGNFWSDRTATVGWKNSGIIRIEIDLEKDAIIDSVSFNSARGQHAGVSYPERADLFVSRDGETYSYLGDLLIGQDHGDGAYQLRTFRSKQLNSSGRKVLLVVRPGGNFTFIDEIEVRGSYGQATRPRAAGPAMAKAAIEAFLTERYSLARDLQALTLLARESQLAGGKGNNETAPVPLRLDRLDREPSRSELGQLRDSMFAMRRAVIARQSSETLTVWHPGPWTVFSPVTLPAPDETIPAEGLTMELPVDGTFSDSIGIANATGRQQSVAVSIELLDSTGRRAPLPAVREVLPVICSDYRTVGDPIRKLRDGSLEIGPGESRQIWFTVRGDDSEPGEYRGKIRLAAPAFSREIPLTIRVWPVRIPRPAHLAVNAWSYLNWRPIRAIPEQAAADLADHRINVIVVHPDHLPWPGSSYEEFDKVLRLHPFAREYLFYLAFNDPGRRSLGTPEPFMSPRWQQKFRQWIQSWVAHLKQKGVSPASFAFYPVDEPQNEEDAAVLFQTARLVKEIDPALRVYTTYGDFGRFSDATFSRLMHVVDQYQIGIDALGQPKVRQLQSAGKDVWSYSGGGKSSDPFDCYRLQAWRAFRHGANGIGFWAYADTGSTGTAWDDFDGTRPDFSVIYEGTGGIISSKRWEAWREGVEDYELLTLAKVRLRDDRERKDFWRMVDDVLANPQDYQRFRMARRRLLEMASRR
ncbi:MAG: DUF4091 domain-containing protein [Geobacteraceae bacterium]|nr:DUF4091 domain-containing protein [Geobacteraceae bacterium]